MRRNTLLCVSVLVVCGLCPAVMTSKPTMFPDKSEIIIQEGDKLRLECRGEGKLHFVMMDTMPEVDASNFKDGGPGKYVFLRPRASKEDTGWYACAEEGVEVENNQQTVDHESRDIAWIYVYVNSPIPFVVDTVVEFITAVAGGRLVVPCRTTSPNLTPRLEINWGMTEIPANTTHDPKIGFILSNVGRELSAQSFECLVDGSDSDTASYTLNVIDPGQLETPIIKKDPQIFRGQDQTLVCAVRVPFGTQKCTISWEVPSVVPTNSWNQSSEAICENIVIGGLQTCRSELTIEKFEASYDGKYGCSAEAGSDAVHQSVDIISLDPERLYYIDWKVEGSNSIKAEKGENAQWKIKITNSNPDDLEWIWRGVDGSEIVTNKTDKNSRYTYTNEEQSNFHYFKILKSNVNDIGNYTIELSTNETEKIIDLHLTVHAVPSVDFVQDSPFYPLRESATFTCKTSGWPLPNVTWFIKEYTDFTSRENSTFEPISNLDVRLEQLDAKNPYDLVSKLVVQINRTGEAMCESCNMFSGKKNCTNSTRPIFVSDVNGRFGLTHPVSVTEGDDVNVICGASVYDFTDKITWRPEDPKQQGFNTPNVHRIQHKSEYTSQSILEIRHVTKANEGTYICEAENKNHENETKTYLLTVHAPQAPLFKNNSMNDTKISVKLGSTMTLYCLTDGQPKPEVVWYKDDQPIVQTGQLKLSNDSTTLRKEIFVDDDIGKYSCRATNRYGTQERYMDIKVSGFEKTRQSNVVWISLICVLIAIIIIVITIMCIKVHRERRLRKELTDAGLTHFEEGAVECLNPELTIDDQAELLPYDKKWEFPRENLKLGRQLGSGAFGVVMKAEARGICVEGEVTTVAVKMVRRTADASYMKALSSELKIMIHLGKHLNVVNLLGACTKTILTKRELYVIVEYCRFGNLHNYLQRHRSSFIDQIDPVTQKIDSNIGVEHLTRSESVNSKNSRLQRAASSFTRSISIRSTDSNSGNELVDYRQGTDFVDINMSPDGGILSNNSVQPGWRSNYRGDYKDQNLKPICTQDLLCWAWQVSRGMEYLSSRNVLHGDLAARNILLAEDNIVKICDFGLAKNMYKDNNYKKKGDGPLPIKWMAVESIRDRMFSTHSDVWSFGIVLWEFFTLARTPYPGMEAEKQYDRLIEGYRMEKPEYATDEIYELMTHCWKAKPTLRPSFPELAEKIGTLMNDSIVTHFMDLNTPYMDMNTIAMENGQSDYLTMMSSPNHDYDNGPDPTSPASGCPDPNYLPMSPMNSAGDPGLFSPRAQLEESHFSFPPPANSTSVNIDSEDCIDPDPRPAPGEPYLKPVDVKQRRADFIKQSKEQSTVDGESAYCNVTIKPDSHYTNFKNQSSENTMDFDDTKNRDKLQGTNVKDSSPAMISEQNNYSNLPKQRSVPLQDMGNGMSNPSYVIMSK